MRSSLRGGLCEGEGERERPALSCYALYAKLAAHQQGELSGDRQAEPRAAEALLNARVSLFKGRRLLRIPPIRFVSTCLRLSIVR